MIVMESVITGAIASVITVGALIIIAGIGEIMAERTGVLNIGIEGIMAMGGAVGALIVNAYVPNVWIALLGGALIGAILGAVFAFASVTLKANQLLVGLAFSFIGNGLSYLIGDSVSNRPTLDRFENIRIPFLADIPLIGEGLFNQNVLVYVAYFVLPIAAYWIIFRTRHGIAIRSVGQDPAAADASGINVHNMRFFYTTFAGMMFGIAGIYLTLALTRNWTEGIVAGRGWIILTLVFFSRLSPISLVLGALLFGGATSLSYIVQVQGWGINSYFLGMLPYVVTLLLITITNLRARRGDSDKAGLIPAMLTLPYFRE
jgi:general nucleoside transport system permease protein